MDVKILEAAWNSFRSSCLKLTSNMVDPLIGKYFTLASFSAAIYKSMFMHHPIGIVPHGGYRNPKRTGQSWEGSAYLAYLNHQRELDGKPKLRCANNALTEVRIGPYKVDGVCPETGDVYEILGCYWHGHTNSADSCHWEERKMVHPTRRPLTFEDVNVQTMARIDQIRESGRPVHAIWTCEIKEQMATDPLLNSFMKDPEMQRRYRQPLDPGKAVFGGRVESFKPRMVLTPQQIIAGYTIEYVDFCSLYPFTQWAYEFTTNPHPTVIVERIKLEKLAKDRLKLLFFMEDNFGLCYCKVEPPQRLDFAVLPYRARDKTVFPLCRTCAEMDRSEVSKKYI